MLLVGYKNNIIRNYFSDGKKFKVEIKYSYLQKTLILAQEFTKLKVIAFKFLLLYCDNYSSLNIKKLDFALNKVKKIILSLVKKQRKLN